MEVRTTVVERTWGRKCCLAVTTYVVIVGTISVTQDVVAGVHRHPFTGAPRCMQLWPGYHPVHWLYMEYGALLLPISLQFEGNL